jgi:hypothetical protein
LNTQDIGLFIISVLFPGGVLYFLYRYTANNLEQSRFVWNLLLLDVATIAIVVYIIIRIVFGVPDRSIVATLLFGITPLKGIMLLLAKKYNIRGHFF